MASASTATTPTSANATTCQLRLPRARSPKTLANSRRAFSTIALGRCASGTTASRVGGTRARSMRRLLSTSSTERAQCVRDTDARPPCEARRDDVGHGDRQDGEDQCATNDLEKRAGGPEQLAAADQRGPAARELGPDPDNEIEEEDLDAYVEGVRDEVFGEGRRAAEGSETEEQHPSAQDDVALDDHERELRRHDHEAQREQKRAQRGVNSHGRVLQDHADAQRAQDGHRVLTPDVDDVGRAHGG